MTESTTRETDVVVIGAGPGGYAAAFAAADAGMQVVLIDAGDEPGGVCLNRGCIPSKTYLHIARLIHEAKHAAAWGISFDAPQVDIDKLREWKNNVVGRNAAGVRQLARSRGVELIRAWARFEDSRTLTLFDVDARDRNIGQVRFAKAILATGSRPATIPAFDIESTRVMNSTGALQLPDIPKSLLVIGGGYIGLEMGTVYAALGSEVTVVEMTDGLLPGADRDLVRVLQTRLKKTFKEILLNTKVAGIIDTDNGLATTFDSGSGQTFEQTFDRALVSVGRVPNSNDIGLENTKAVINERGFVEVDRQQRTADEHIYAIGDVAGEPMLAHKASRQAKVAAEALAGEAAEFDNQAIPAVVFTDPEIAWAGLTETEAAMKGIEIETAKFPWGASGRATALDRNDGLTKLIVSPEDKRVLGVGIVGVDAGEMISEAVVAIEMGAVAQDLAMSIHPHPTLSETIAEAAELAFGTATHIYRPRR